MEKYKAEIGDRVTIRDGSYMETYRDGSLTHYGMYPSTHTIGWCTDLFVVTDIGTYPINIIMDLGKAPNNTIIKNTVNGELWTCRSEISLTLQERPRSCGLVFMKPVIMEL